MANHKSAKKRARQTITRTARNKADRSEVRSAIKKIRAAISENNKEAAKELLPKTQGLLRKLAKKGVIKVKNASRITSRLHTQTNSL